MPKSNTSRPTPAPARTREWPADKTERWSIERLIPYAKNSRVHSEAQVAQIAASIREWGWTIPVLAAEDGSLIAGHGRILAARQLGITEIPVMVAHGWSEAHIRAYRIADNKLTLNGTWSDELLRLELGELKLDGFDLSLTGFGELELGDILAERTEGLTDPDDAPPVPERPVSQTGDLWIMGRHRLLCGDSTVATDVEKVLGGVAPHLMVTDPPYGVEYDPAWRATVGSKRWDKTKVATGAVQNDNAVSAAWSAVWPLFPGDVAYVWCASLDFSVAQSLQAADFELRSQIIWVKDQAIFSRGHYHWQHEGCLYAVRKSSAAHWVADRKQTTVWQIRGRTALGDVSNLKGADKKTGHGTQKPIDCMRRPIENNSSPGQAVYEPFSGSGTTIIAAEQTGRACHAIEISGAYVDVAVKRWQAFTGKAATLDGDGRSFDEIAPARAEQSAEAAA